MPIDNYIFCKCATSIHPDFKYDCQILILEKKGKK